MKDYIKPPRLSTSFSQNGIKVRNRFANILDMRRKRRGIIALMLIVSTALVFSGCFLDKTTADEDDSVNVAIMGIDASGERSDVILLASMDGGNLTVTQIPRDTYVSVNDGGKIGRLSAPEDILSGIAEAANVKCDKYISVSFDGLKNIVDAIGGIDFNVPMDMHYSDPYQDFEINLSAGEQHLDGAMLEMLMRYRMSNPDAVTGLIEGYENGDLDRLAIQRSVYMAVAAKLIDNGVTAELPKIITENTDTNLTISDFAEIVTRALMLNMNNISIEMLAGSYTENEQLYIPYNGKRYVDNSNADGSVSSYNIYAEEDTISFSTKMISARIKGTEYDLTGEDIGIMTMYNERLNTTLIQGTGVIHDISAMSVNREVYVKGSLTGNTGVFSVREGVRSGEAWKKQLSAASINAQISEIPVNGGELVITGTDSDTKIVLELTPYIEDVQFETEVKSARVNGVNCNVTKTGDRNSKYENNAFWIYYTGDIDENYELDLIPNLHADNSLGCCVHIIDKETKATKESYELDISSLTADDGTFTLIGIDSDTEIVLELTKM